MNRVTIASFACTIALVWTGLADAAERAIDKEVVVAAPIQAVWQSWTTKAGIESFFAPEAEIELKVGGVFHIHINLKKRHDSGPVDWTEWLARLKVPPPAAPASK